MKYLHSLGWGEKLHTSLLHVHWSEYLQQRKEVKFLGIVRKTVFMQSITLFQEIFLFLRNWHFSQKCYSEKFLIEINYTSAELLTTSQQECLRLVRHSLSLFLAPLVSLGSLLPQLEHVVQLMKSCLGTLLSVAFKPSNFEESKMFFVDEQNILQRKQG